MTTTPALMNKDQVEQIAALNQTIRDNPWIPTVETITYVQHVRWLLLHISALNEVIELQNKLLTERK